MKRKITITTLLVCSIFVCLAAIADLTGKWTGNFSMGGNDFTLTYIFKVEGEKLTGTVQSPQGDLPMYEGVIKNGTDFSFKVDVGGEAVVNKGKYYTDSVVVTANVNGELLKSTLKRDK